MPTTKADISEPMPDWLQALRSHDFQPQKMPPPLRKFVEVGMKRRGIQLWTPGKVWASRGNENAKGDDSEQRRQPY